MSEAFADMATKKHRCRREKTRLITIDLDPTIDPIRGSQQWSLFNGFYDTWYYLRLAGLLTFDREPEPEQYLFLSVALGSYRRQTGRP